MKILGKEMVQMKEKFKNLIFMFRHELTVIASILILWSTERIGYIINSNIPELGISPSLFANISMGLFGWLLLATTALMLVIAILMCSVFQICYYTIIFFIKINKKIDKIIAQINNKDYKSIEECIYDVIPAFCRKATFAELGYKEKRSFIIICCPYLDDVLFKIDESFSTDEYTIETYIIDFKSIGYKKQSKYSDDINIDKVITAKNIMKNANN
jgi:hypothetical protein